MRASGLRGSFLVVACALACGKVAQDSAPAPLPDAGAVNGPFDGAASGGSTNAGGVGVADSGLAGTPVDAAVLNSGAQKLGDGTTFWPQVVSDRSAHALVLWTDTTGHSNSRQWDPERERWSEATGLLAHGSGAYLAPAPQLFASAAGEFPVVAWMTSEDAANAVSLTLQAFDFAHRAWSTPTVLTSDTAHDEWQIRVDPLGNTHAFWRTPNAGANYWAWRRAADTQWSTAVSMPEASQLVQGPGTTFLWSDRSALLVQAFDPGAGAWSDPVDLRDLRQSNLLSGAVHILVTARDDSALMVEYRQDEAQTVVTAWHWQSSTRTWGPPETVLESPLVFAYQADAAADPGGDFVWVPLLSADGSTELDVMHFDPIAGTWQTSRVLPGGTSQTARLLLRFDDSGRAYGTSGLTRLTRIDPLNQVWADSPNLDIALDTDVNSLLPSARGALAVGRASGQRVVAFKSDAGGDWRPTQGLPQDPQATTDIVHVNASLAGPERALVVWTTQSAPLDGLWASFVE